MSSRPRVGKPIPNAEARLASLEAVVPEVHRPWFRWIVAMRLGDGTRIDVFAHEFTNRELLLGDDGSVFSLTPTFRYRREVDVAEAVEQALPHRHHWLEMGGYEGWNLVPEPWNEQPDGNGPIERWRPRSLVADVLAL